MVRSSERIARSRTPPSNATSTNPTSNSEPTCATSSMPTTSPEGSRPSKASPLTNSSVRHGLHSPSDSNSTRSSKCRDYQLKAARFPNYRDLAGFDFVSSEVNEALTRQLYRCEFLDDAHNVVLVGGP